MICLFSLKMECDKLASEKSEMQRHYIMVSDIMLVWYHTKAHKPTIAVIVCLTHANFAVLWDVLWTEHWNAQTGKRPPSAPDHYFVVSFEVFTALFSKIQFFWVCFFLPGWGGKETEWNLCSSSPLPITRGMAPSSPKICLSNFSWATFPFRFSIKSLVGLSSKVTVQISVDYWSL